MEQHLPLVRHIVFQLAVAFPRYVDREELVRAGALGLVEAALRFDETRGVPFERYAATRIRGAVVNAVRSTDWAPRSVRSASRRLGEVEQELAARLGRVPTTDEVATAFGVDPAELRTLQHRAFRAVVLALEHELAKAAAGRGGDEDLTLVDLLPDRSHREPGEELENRELKGYLRDAVRLLPERQRLVIVGYFLEGRTSQELADFLGVTESRISQLRSEALATLRDGLEAQYPPMGTDASESVVPAVGRVARRKVAYAAAISSASAWRARLAAHATPNTAPVPHPLRAAG